MFLGVKQVVPTLRIDTRTKNTLAYCCIAISAQQCASVYAYGDLDYYYDSCNWHPQLKVSALHRLTVGQGTHCSPAIFVANLHDRIGIDTLRVRPTAP